MAFESCLDLSYSADKELPHWERQGSGSTAAPRGCATETVASQYLRLYRGFAPRRGTGSPLMRAVDRRGMSAATIPARGIIPMSNLSRVVDQLRQERQEAQKKINQLDQALAALGGRGGVRTKGKQERRTMSAGARKKIAAAQRARWAKWKAARKA